MKQIKNEKGISLVIVLLIIVVFTVLGLAVIGLSLSNVKQINKSEVKNQAIDLAEMGSQYYKAKLEDDFLKHFFASVNSISEPIETEINNEIATILKSGKTYNRDDYIKEALNQLKMDIDLLYNNEEFENVFKKKPYPLYNNASFFGEPTGKPFRTNIDYNKETIEIEFSFNSTGTVNNITEEMIETKLKYTVKINKGAAEQNTSDFWSIIKRPKKDNGEEFDECKKFTDGKDEFVRKTCKYSNSISAEKQGEIKDSTLIFEKGLILTKNSNLKVENNPTIYITGQTSFFKHIYGIKTSNVFIQSPILFDNINNSIDDSTIVIIGQVEFERKNNNGTLSIGDVENSKIYIDGNVLFSGKTKINDFKDSLWYIRGDVDFTNVDFKEAKNSKICVDGKVASPPSNVNVYSTFTNKDAFQKACPVLNGGDPSDDLLTSIKIELLTEPTIKYNYH
ncbi:hypothetical protein [Metabacillus fastidiosus]|uniref:hypothetical protein n=1 Tax=Metabacillus fastidiosus TaxID=1458 RepID=UPI000826E586|nr:hypothetical protein [Metabacillus fastidiosus]MED4464029.1 hypothetical protein [Metabacillus fastidiosus]